MMIAKVRGCRCAFVALLGAVLVALQRAEADPLNTLFNTGVDNAGNALGSQVVDPHYRLIVSPDGVFTGPDAFTTDPIPSPPWIANSPTSRWITPRPDDGGIVVPGEYVYRLEFDLPGLLPSTAQITGGFATDDGGSIRLNGVDVGVASGGFGGLTKFTVTGNFVPGTNTLDFVVNNGDVSPNPSGLRVENLAGTATAPTVNLSTAFDQLTATTIAHGNLDSDWSVVAAPAGVTLGTAKSIAKNPGWFGADPNARWIAPQDAVSGSSDLPAGVYTYQNTFTLAEVGKLFELDGNIGSDDPVLDFRINGTSVASNFGGFSAPDALPNVIDQTLFVDGLNIIEVDVLNGGVSPNPTGFHLTAWIQEVGNSTAPIADANGPYLLDIAAGDTLMLDASGSFDIDVALGDTITLYEWDLDNDGTFDFASTSPLLNLTQAQYSPFITGFGISDIALRVTDATGLTGTDLGTLNAVPEPTSWALGTLAALGMLAGWVRKRRTSSK